MPFEGSPLESEIRWDFFFLNFQHFWLRSALASLVSTVPGRRPPSECSPGTRSCQGGNLIKFDLIDALEIVIKRTNNKQRLHSKSRILLSVERLSLGMRAWVETVRATCKASATAHSLTQSLRWLKHFMIICRIISISSSFSFLQGVDWSRDVDSLCSNPRPQKLGKPDQQRAGEVGQLRRPHPVLGQALWAIQRRQQEETQCCPRSYWKVRQHFFGSCRLFGVFLNSSNWPIIPLKRALDAKRKQKAQAP